MEASQAVDSLADSKQLSNKIISPLQEEVEEGAEEETGNGIDGIMSLDVKSTEEKQNSKGQEDKE